MSCRRVVAKNAIWVKFLQGLPGWWAVMKENDPAYIVEHPGTSEEYPYIYGRLWVRKADDADKPRYYEPGEEYKGKGGLHQGFFSALFFKKQHLYHPPLPKTGWFQSLQTQQYSKDGYKRVVDREEPPGRAMFG